MSNCLVTGGAGFIGSHIVEALLANDHEVRILDNFSTGSLANLAHVGDRVELLTGDVTDLEAVHSAMRDIELVFHLAAVPSIGRSLSDPSSTHQIGATGTLNVLLAAREARVRRVIYSASAACYGDVGPGRRHENEPLHPLSPYGVAVLAGEYYCAAFSSAYGLETVRLRLFNVFGPRQSFFGEDAAVIPLFLRAMMSGQKPVIHGDGLQSRDFIDVDDVVQANLLAAEAPRVSGRAYNIATGRSSTILEVLKRINTLLETDLRPIHAPARPGEIRHSQADISRAQADLGYCPCTDLDRGLRRCVESYAGRRKSPEFHRQPASKVG
jgi:UDP-glucose 4-epimerase